jgi:DNA-binding CsgD family transcriptional regulator
MELMVESLYDGVLSPPAWGDALQAVCTRVGAYAFHQLSIDRETRAVGSVAVSVNSTPPPMAKLIEYETHYAALDVRMSFFWSLREGQVMLDHEHMAATTFSREPIYADFLASLGMRHTACIPARDGPQSRDFVGFMRHVDQRPYGEAEHAVLRFVQPHVVRANRLRFQSQALAPEAALGFAALETLPQAVAVLGPQCQVRYLNGAAQRTLAQQQAGLGVRHGRLHCSDAAAQERLGHHVAAACGAGLVRTAGLVRLGPGAAGLAASVLPLRAAHPLAGPWHATPRALVTWRCAAGQWEAEQLGAVLGLSPVESRLALHLAQGHSVKAFAVAQGCSWHTVRTHVRNLLRKTGCHGQQELVQLVQSVVVV